MHEDAAGAQSDRPANRPALHLTTRSGWINDPMGLTYHGGRYHMFFQYVPAQVLWGPQCWWGHAVSEDLLSWTEREPILWPGDGDGGCWSGSLAVDDAGRATIFYTSVQLDDLDLGQIRTAQPDDVTWDTWQKGSIRRRHQADERHRGVSRSAGLSGCQWLADDRRRRPPR